MKIKSNKFNLFVALTIAIGGMMMISACSSANDFVRSYNDGYEYVTGDRL